MTFAKSFFQSFNIGQLTDSLQAEEFGLIWCKMSAQGDDYEPKVKQEWGEKKQVCVTNTLFLRKIGYQATHNENTGAKTQCAWSLAY